MSQHNAPQASEQEVNKTLRSLLPGIDWNTHRMAPSLKIIIHNDLSSQPNVDKKTLLRKLLNLDELTQEEINTVGKGHISKGHLNSAKICLQKSTSFSLNFDFGMALLTKGKIEEAIAAFKISVELKDDFLDSIYALGEALVKQKKFSEAEPYLRKVIDLAPTQRQDLANDDEDLDEEVYNKNDRLIKLEQHANFQLGVALNNQGLALKASANNDPQKAEDMMSYHQKALECFRKLVSLDPNYDAALFNVAISLAYQAKYKEAEELFKKVIEQQPEDMRAQVNYAMCLKVQGKFEEAKAAAEQALKIANPMYSENIASIKIIIDYASKHQAMAQRQDASAGSTHTQTTDNTDSTDVPKAPHHASSTNDIGTHDTPSGVVGTEFDS